MMMANPNTNNAALSRDYLAEQVRVQGEMLARLTVIVEEDHKDLDELKHSTEIIARAVAAQETRDTVKADIKSKVLYIGVPLSCTLVGVLAGHLIH
jgi:hypothetical protein